MAGSFLQLVANTGPQDFILMGDPQITFFKKLYRRHTNFALEDIRVNFENRVDFGSGARAIIPKSGDLLRRIYVVVEIPSIAAAFINTKTQDIIQLIQNFTFVDLQLAHTLMSSIHRDVVELPLIFNTVFDTEKYYAEELFIRECILNEISKLTDSVNDLRETPYARSTFDPTVCRDLRTSSVCRSLCVNTCSCGSDKYKYCCILKRLSRCVTLRDLELDADYVYDFHSLKMSLADIWLRHKKEYALSYRLIQLEYLTNRHINSLIPTVTTPVIASVVLYEKIFNETIPDPEILSTFYISSLDVTNNLQFSKLTDPFPSALEIFDNKINAINESVCEVRPYMRHILDSDCPKKCVFDPNSTDTHTMLVSVAKDKQSDPDILQGIQKKFTTFGSSFYYILNSYSTIINVVRSLARTTPIIVAKTFGFTRPNVNIYRDTTTALLSPDVYPTVLDPNFSNSYLLKVNDLKKPCCRSFCDESVPIYPNEPVNAYLTLFNQQATAMMNNITNGMNTLFDAYKSRLFTETSTLFLDNRPPLRSVYSYSAPTRGYVDQEELRIQNVMNLNIWFFYFFNYLGRFRGENYVNYLRGYTRTVITQNGAVFASNLISLLQLNLEYYMNEISYNLNDLYAHSPSSNTNDSLNTYVPVAFSPVIQKSPTSPQIRVATDLLAVTTIFHRNHVPTILEMFQFIYYFIDTISIADMNSDLCRDSGFVPVTVMDPEEECSLRSLVKLFYYQVFGYFMDIYDSFGFEAPAKFSTTEFDTCEAECNRRNRPVSRTSSVSFTTEFNADVDTACLSKIVKQYVAYFLKGVQIRPALQFNQTQPVVPNISQMEFYFVSEMLNMRQQQKLYHNVLFNTDLIRSTVGSTSAYLIKIVTDQIRRRNARTQDTCRFDECKDRVRVYWDKLYQSSMLARKKECLYYSTFNTRRYVGLPYKNTAYVSRNYGQVVPPISDASPLPPTNPYGIKTDYYNHRSICPEKDIPVYWVVNSRSSGRVDTSTSSQEFQIFDIDYFRIKHSIFYDCRLVLPHRVRLTSTYQNSLFIAVVLTERLLEMYPVLDPFMIHRLLTAVCYLVEETDPVMCYTSYLRIYDLGCNPTFAHTLHVYFHALTTTEELSQSLVTEALNCLREMSSLFDSGVIVQQYAQLLPVQYRDLTALNRFVESTVNDVCTSTNIVDLLEFLQNVYVTHYFYYAKKIETITSLYSLSLITDNPLNISDTIDDVKSSILAATDSDDLDQQISALFAQFPNWTTIGDVYRKVIRIYDLSVEISRYPGICEHLQKYQPYLLAKLELIQELTQFISVNDLSCDRVDDLVDIGKNYCVDLRGYVVETLLPTYCSICNPKKRMVVISDMLNRDIDQIFLTNIGITQCESFRECIIQDASDSLKPLLTTVPNEYLVYIVFAYEHRCSQSINPLYNISFDLDSVVKFYGSFRFLSDFLMYLMDYVWDDTMLLQERRFENWMGFDKSFSRTVNLIHYESDQKICERSRISNVQRNENLSADHSLKLSRDQKQIADLTRSAIRTNEVICDLRRANHTVRSVRNSVLFAMCESELPEETKIEICSRDTECQPVSVEESDVQTDSYDFREIRIRARSEIVCFMKEVVGRSVILLGTMRTEIDQFKKQLSNIAYRNRRARVAWIRKLAHFLIESVTMKFGDQILDIHRSDWFESYHALSGTPEHESGYLKMIGHREDLIVYNDKVKRSYQVVLPLIFYFNKSPALAIPLNASIYTQFELNLNLRKIDDVLYKEQFSDFVDPVLLNRADVDLVSARTVPSIQDAYLMCEYVYLSKEERHVFVTNRLDYLIDEVQSDAGVTVTDSNLEPVYRLKADNTLITENRVRELGRSVDMSVCPRDDLVPRSDTVWERIRDNSVNRGKTVAKLKPLPIDRYIQAKRIHYRHYFHNPAQLMVFLIKPMIHTQLVYRTDESSYFYGEKQWDNYNLYSYYDLTKIQRIKLNWLATVREKMNDTGFNYLRILNQMLLEPLENAETVQFLKDSFMSYSKKIEDYSSEIRLKENLLSLSISFHITSLETLELLMQDVVQTVRETNSVIVDFSLDSMREAYNYVITDTVQINRETFRLIMMRLFLDVINGLDLTVKQLESSIDTVYEIYNEDTIDKIIGVARTEVDLSKKPYSIVQIVEAVRSVEDISEDVVLVSDTLNRLSVSEIEDLNTGHINNLWYKNIIYQTTFDRISHAEISRLAAQINRFSNENYNRYTVSLVDYAKYTVLNPVVNPLISGHISFNDAVLMHVNSDAMWLTTASAYKYAKRTPHSSINIFSWALDPFSDQTTGATNLSRIDDFSSVYDLHPKISSEYPASIVTTITSLNIIRFLSGLCGKAWETV